MSIPNYLAADRRTEHGRLRFMVATAGYVMCRYPQAYPQVWALEAWLALPLWAVEK